MTSISSLKPMFFKVLATIPTFMGPSGSTSTTFILSRAFTASYYKDRPGALQPRGYDLASREMAFAEVLLPLAIDPLWYRVPESLRQRVRPGVGVLVPLKGRKRLGVVLSLRMEPPEGLDPEGVREVEAVEEGPRLLSPEVIELMRFASSHYLSPLGLVLKTASPGIGRDISLGLTRKAAEILARGEADQLLSTLRVRPLTMRTLERRFGRDEVQRAIREGLIAPHRRTGKGLPADIAEVGGTPPPATLTPWQERALETISHRQGAPLLLFGVTGSGKTEVYLRAAQMALEAGKGVLILVPEIALTPQLYTRFKRRLGGTIAVLHSAMTPAERREQLRMVASGEIKVVLGARSALFAPLEELGLIVVDEEHDPSYKQAEGGFKYNARDMALVRGRLQGATVILGSATPSVESFYNAKRGKFTLIELPQRIGGPLPRVEVVDMRGKKGIISPELLEALRECLSSGEQAILFLNRRGYASFMLCEECGEVLKCRNCSVSLTYHASREVLLCHYCGYALKAPQVCPGCGGGKMKPLGFGTERIVAELERLLPGKRIQRMDSDVVSRRRDYERILKGLEEGSIDVLVGTQMVVKGHDFPKIGLVGVVLADIPLNLPDFRSAERTFQLLSQAAGRAGRGRGGGRVIVQTYAPGHYAIKAAADSDYRSFFREEIKRRRELLYPPFCRLAAVRISGRDLEEVRGASERLYRYLDGREVKVLGPAPAPIERLSGRWRWQLLLKARGYRALKDALGELPAPKGMKVEVDIDPLSLL